MKKIFLIIITFIFMISVNALNLNSDYAYVYNLKEQKVMYEKDSNEKIPVASLTKIMTAIVAIENNDLTEEVIVNDYDLRDMYVYATAGFRAGDKLTVKDLLYGVLLPSGSEAVNAIVRVTTETEEEFIELMNNKAKEIGLNNTHFSNAIGKDNGNYSTMYDMAKILEYALKNETFKEIFTSANYTVNDMVLNGPLSRMNFNMVSGAKTGFTYAAMYCFASFSQKDNFDYIAVTAHADSYEDVMNDHENIYNYYFDNYDYYDYNVNFDLKIEHGKEEYYNVNVDSSFYLENNYNKKLLNYKYEGVDLINKKIKKGDKLGTISIYYDNELLGTQDIYLEKELEYKNYILTTIYVVLIFFLLLLFIRKIKMYNC